MRVRNINLQEIIDNLFEHGLFTLWLFDGLCAGRSNMHHVIQKAIAHPWISLGTATLWGILEFLALQRLRRQKRRKRKPAQAPTA